MRVGSSEVQAIRLGPAAAAGLKLGSTNISFGAPQDPFGANVQLLLHMNGANGSTTFTDSSLNNFTVTRFGDAQISTTQSKYGGASGYFDGNGDYVTVYDSNAFNFGNGDFTVECWIKPDSNPSPQFVVGAIITTASPTDQQGIFLGITPSRELYWFYSNGGSWIGPTGNPITETTISDSIWSHIAWVRSGNNTYLYVNGQQIASGSMTGTLTNTNNAILVGGRTDSTQYYAGYIDDLRITKGIARYTSNFTPPTAQFPDPVVPTDPYGANVSLLLHMNGSNGSTTFTDSSLNNFTVTRFGDAQISTAQFKYGGAAGYFDGNGGYLILPGNEALAMGSENYTIEMWMYLNSNAQFAFIDTNPAGTPGLRPNGFCWFMETSQQTRLYFNGDNIISSSTNAIPLNQWFHAALVRSNGITTIYINGIDVGSTNASYNATAAIDGSLIGTFCDALFLSPDGYIDDLRITKGVARYTSSFTPPAAQLLDP